MDFHLNITQDAEESLRPDNFNELAELEKLEFLLG